MHRAGFSPCELKLLEMLEKLIADGERDNLENKAAILLKLSPITVRTRLSRLRTKYKQNRQFMSDYRSWQQKLYQRSGGKFHSL